MVTLIVMEPRSEWPRHIHDSDNVVAVGSNEEGLVQRTRQELESIRQQGQLVRVAVLACNEATDPASLRRRAEVANELLTALATAGLGHLILSSVDGASVQLQCELLSLAGVLSEGLRGNPDAVSIKFARGDGRAIGLADGIGMDRQNRTGKRLREASTQAR